ncbi:LPXTG cell wall anchor domain-containing protein [Enterococcus hulanensis]|uniref:LPXTG cell wall anchor domain-containing protein n=1 Tax=Enterococcus TaxID=1350 RepID=UPI000B5A308A|nr:MULTISPECIES: LPXTG cell wall anchor domain-containing protein [Enterococcus]MBO0410585.1 LPXTG cell wall anchor domain-containing protein [Enterococcus hulanensis]OTO21606.1 hypothetical protein A5875_002988 [Enterococcus sp. 3H8_DIV0648]
MKNKNGLILLVGLFCLSISTASVYAASYSYETPVGVGFVGSTSSSSSSSSTSSSTSTSATTSSSSSSSSSSSNSSNVESSSSSLPDTESSQRKVSSFFWGNDRDGGTSGTTRYYSDGKLLPKTGELVTIALPFVGLFLILFVFFYSRRSRRERV